ncbi:MAG: hypothetical protein ABH969_04150, partial [Pseudomonadota bacterium]
LKRLKDIYIVENMKNQYRITDHEELNIIFKKHIKEFYLKNILERVEPDTVVILAVFHAKRNPQSWQERI